MAERATIGTLRMVACQQSQGRGDSFATGPDVQTVQKSATSRMTSVARKPTAQISERHGVQPNA
jgi:hypothetical protein